MKNNLEQFIKSAKQLSLSNKEKSDIKDSVFNFVKNHPVRSEVKSRLTYGSNIFLIPILSKFLIWIQNRGSSIGNMPIGTKFNFSSAMAILLLISVLIGGGVAVGAERALPGDTLYPVKVGLNEEVRGWLFVSEEAKANWELKRVHRRLEEAEKLASSGDLDADTGAKIEANFEAHALRVKSRVEKFRNKENFNAAASISLNFEAALEAHDRILSRLAEDGDDIEVQLKPIRAKIKSEVKRSAEERMQFRLEIEDEDEDEEKDEEEGMEEDDDLEDDINLESETKIDVDSSLGGTSGRLEGRIKANLDL